MVVTYNLLCPFTKTHEITKHKYIITALFNLTIKELIFRKKKYIKSELKKLINTICKCYMLNICENNEHKFIEK